MSPAVPEASAWLSPRDPDNGRMPKVLATSIQETRLRRRTELWPKCCRMCVVGNGAMGRRCSRLELRWFELDEDCYTIGPSCVPEVFSCRTAPRALIRSLLGSRERSAPERMMELPTRSSSSGPRQNLIHPSQHSGSKRHGRLGLVKRLVACDRRLAALQA
jgi:hypothetical protein